MVQIFVSVNYYLISLISKFILLTLRNFKNLFYKWFQNLLICFAYMQGKLNIFSIYRFMLSVSHIEDLTALLYVLHVCRGSFTSPFIYCILCFMWLGFSHPFSYKCMYTRGVNFTSLLFMNVYSIYTFIVLIYGKRKKNIIYTFSVCTPLLMN